MNKYRGTDKDIHSRIYKFIIGCFKDVVKKIPKSTENLPIINQLSSSLTSIGANDQEADTSSSKKDFIAKCQIVKKETKETHYWLCFTRDANLVERSIVDPHITEVVEILKIISKIIDNTKQNEIKSE